MRFALDRFDAGGYEFFFAGQRRCGSPAEGFTPVLGDKWVDFYSETLHPAAIGGANASGWRDGSWNVLNGSVTKLYDW